MFVKLVRLNLCRFDQHFFLFHLSLTGDYDHEHCRKYEVGQVNSLRTLKTKTVTSLIFIDNLHKPTLME